MLLLHEDLQHVTALLVAVDEDLEVVVRAPLAAHLHVVRERGDDLRRLKRQLRRLQFRLVLASVR